MPFQNDIQNKTFLYSSTICSENNVKKGNDMHGGVCSYTPQLAL